MENNNETEKEIIRRLEDFAMAIKKNTRLMDSILAALKSTKMVHYGTVDPEKRLEDQ